MTVAGYHHVEDVMGTAVSIDVRDPVLGTPGLSDVLTWLHHVDSTFSTYRRDSPISRLGRGEMSLGDVSDEVRDVLLQCETLRHVTDGAFDAFAVPAPNGTSLDPSGLVKGWSIERAAQLLEQAGLRNFCLNAGGDVAIRGHARTDEPWRVGVRAPHDVARLAALFEVSGRVAVATSATYERGAHIVDPRTGESTTGIASVTVVGPDLGLADAYATAVFVMGAEGIEWIGGQHGYDVLMLTHDHRELTTPGFTRWRTNE
ncbi:MAG: FAD:protein transferase [Actinomycetota bacterium]